MNCLVQVCCSLSIEKRHQYSRYDVALATILDTDYSLQQID